MSGVVRQRVLAALSAVVLAVVVGCGGGDSGGSGGSPASGKGGTINVAIVDNPQMKDIAALTPKLFTPQSGVKVKYTVLDEGTLRQVTTRDVAAGGRQFDVVMIGMYEAPQFGSSGSLVDLTSMAKSTWQEVAEIAQKVNSSKMAGICLRGKPGWGDLGASFTTVLNTFGGTWWSSTSDGKIDQAEVNKPEFKQALDFYVNLVKSSGEKDAANASFNECLSQYKDGKVAMWYDATVAAGLLEASDSPVKGKNGFAPAPVDKTDASGWLWSWALAMPKTSQKQDLGWKYIAWATGPDYLKAAGSQISGGWAAIPPGTRNSTYEIPEYKKAAAAFAGPTLKAMSSAPINNPGTSKRPGLPGVQYVGVPEFQDVGNQCTQQFSAVIAGRSSVDGALSNCQQIASQAAGS
jgi:sorbitol/mannitol transport system substrate-binding protein